MDVSRVVVEVRQRLSLIDSCLRGYSVFVYRLKPPYFRRYAIVAKNDKIAANKGLRRFVSDILAINDKNRK